MGSIRTEDQPDKFRIGVDVGGTVPYMTCHTGVSLLTFVAIRYQHRRCAYLTVADTDNRIA
jgi:hypothetical protein